MHETCKSCGTVFEVNESILTKNIQWLKCGVCSKKWSLSSTAKENLIENNVEIKDKAEKVKQELASIKLAVEDKSKILAKNAIIILECSHKLKVKIPSFISCFNEKKYRKTKIFFLINNIK